MVQKVLKEFILVFFFFISLKPGQSNRVCRLLIATVHIWTIIISKNILELKLAVLSILKKSKNHGPRILQTPSANFWLWINMIDWIAKGADPIH